MHVIISGGGVSGLATALALHQRGIKFDLYERSFEALTAGMGFVLVRQGTQALNQFGLSLNDLSAGQALRRFILHKAHGEVKYTQILGDGTLGIRRKDLLSAMLRHLPGASVHFSEAIENYLQDKRGDFVAAELTSGKRLKADVFVAADGVRSVARQHVDANWQAHDARVFELVGMVRNNKLRQQLGQEFHKYQHPQGGLAFGMLPVDEQTLVWYLQFDKQRFAPPSNVPLEKHLFLQETVGKWAKPIPDILAQTNFDQVHLWRPINADPLQRFFHRNLALIGDAAHPLLPFTSQGVSSAVGDAECLGAALAQVAIGNSTLDTALKFYSDTRYQACLPYVEQGRQLTDGFLSPQLQDQCQLPIAK